MYSQAICGKRMCVCERVCVCMCVRVRGEGVCMYACMYVCVCVCVHIFYFTKEHTSTMASSYYELISLVAELHFQMNLACALK